MIMMVREMGKLGSVEYQNIYHDFFNGALHILRQPGEGAGVHGKC